MAGVTSDMLIADMRHYLGENLEDIDLPAPAARLREYLGSIVEAVTSRPEEETNYVTSGKCRKRVRRKPCEGHIVACFDEEEPGAIRWLCPLCCDGGYIRGWEGTVWDRRNEK